MFKALNVQNQIIEAVQANKHELFYCPGCNKSVYLKKGKINQVHFAHYDKTHCKLFSEGETEEHLLGKQLLYDWFINQGVNCQLEPFLPELKQRPDLLIQRPKEPPIVIEFQCSSLSVNRMIARTNGYKSKGYIVYWILGKRFHLHKKMTSFQHLFLNESQNIKNFYLQLDSIKGELSVLMNIYLEKLPSQIQFDETRFSLHQLENTLEKCKIDTINNKSPKAVRTFSFIENHQFLNKGRIYQHKAMIEFQRYIYSKGFSLVSLPKEVYFPIEDDVYIKSIPHFWKFYIVNWLIEIGSGNIVTNNQLEQKYVQMITEKRLIYYLHPCFSKVKTNSTMNQYMSILIMNDILIPLSQDEWLIYKTPQCYHSEEEKNKEFEKLSNKINTTSFF